MDLLLIFAEGMAICVLAYVLAGLICAPFLLSPLPPDAEATMSEPNVDPTARARWNVAPATTPEHPHSVLRTAMERQALALANEYDEYDVETLYRMGDSHVFGDFILACRAFRDWRHDSPSPVAP